MRFLNRRDNPNALFGLFFLIMLAVFAGPTTLPRLISSTIPFADEGVPCDWLRPGEDRANHQSLIGRAASVEDSAPISLQVTTGALPTDPNGTYEITITVTNTRIAPVPILVTDGRLILDPNSAESGFGVVFNTDAAIPNLGDNVGGAYAEERIRILEPRQRCIHRVQVPFNQIPNASILVADNTSVKVFYRNNAPGTIPLQTEDQPFTDQGLWVGVVESPLRTVGDDR